MKLKVMAMLVGKKVKQGDNHQQVFKPNQI